MWSHIVVGIVRKKEPFGMITEIFGVDTKFLEEKHYYFEPTPPRMNSRENPPKEKIDFTPEQTLPCGYEADALLHITLPYAYILAWGEKNCCYIMERQQYPVYDIRWFSCPSVDATFPAGDVPYCQKCRGGRDSDDKACMHAATRYYAQWINKNFQFVDFNLFSARLRSYHEWRAPMEPTLLAKKGFIYNPTTRQGVMCVYCKYQVERVLPGVDVQTRHRSSCPNCPFFSLPPEQTNAGPEKNVCKKPFLVNSYKDSHTNSAPDHIRLST